MRIRKFNLGATESYRERVAVLMDGGSLPAERFLAITTRAGRKTVTVTYMVNRDPSRPNLVAHLMPIRGDEGESGEGGPYWVECRGGLEWTCNCRGSRPNGSRVCKHVAACQAIQKEGGW